MPGISFRYCDANYKVTPDPVDASLNYWSADFSAASNIIFSNGLLDPWHAGNLAHLSAFRDISLDIFYFICKWHIVFNTESNKSKSQLPLFIWHVLQSSKYNEVQSVLT